LFLAVVCILQAAAFFGLLKQEKYYREELISYEALQNKIKKYMITITTIELNKN
jgi:hypothetical protein